MATSTPLPGCLPSWVHSLGTPVWVSDPEGNIGYLNDHAETLLGADADACVGRPCYEVIAGTGATGRPHCRADCPVITRARRVGAIEPFHLSVSGSQGQRRWVQVLVIAIRASGKKRPWLVHCAIPCDKARRIEAYLSRVAARTSALEVHPGARRDVLTRRERQILDLLEKDHDLYMIADELCISHATVRNHVQHILAKLHVHSIVEAVASELVEPPDGRSR